MKFRINILILMLPAFGMAQVGINTVTPSPAASLEVSSSADDVSFGGFMPPRVTLMQRNLIPVTASDDGLLIFLQNGNQRCLQVYDGVEAQWRNVYCMPVNAAPLASSVSVSGTTTDGQTLTGSFTYSDADSDPPAAHSYKWYRADTSAGTGAVAIAGATSTTYTLTPADVGKHIAFEVTPAASSGTSPGIAARSAYTTAVDAKPTIISFVQLNQSKNENANPNTIILRFSFPNVSATAVNVTVASSSYTRLTQSGPRTITIPAGQTSPYNIAVFNVNNNLLDDNNASLTFTITNVTGGTGVNSVGMPNTDTCTIVDDEVSLTFTENFQNFVSGFAPNPTSTQLDSDIWRVDNWGGTWGGTHTTGTLARGSSTGNAPLKGVYSYQTGSGNRCIGLNIDMYFGGGIVFRIRNTTGATLTNWTFNYSAFVRDNTTWGNTNFSTQYATTEGNWTPVPGSTINTGSGTNNAWSQYPVNANITASVPPNGYLYLRLYMVNDQMFQDTDEVGIDNIVVTGRNF